MLHLLIQLGAIVNFAYTIYWDLYILKLPGKPTFGGQWKFLTFWNLWLQLIYFTISLLSNSLGSQKASKLQKIRDYLFATLAFPIGQFVGIVFWLLFHVDRELVFPLHYDKFFPNYINHAMHTTVIPAQLLELYLLYHAYPKRIQGMTTTMIFCFIYLTWTLVVAHFGGVWVYPIFEVLAPVPRFLFMLACSMFGALLYIIGEILNNLVWAKPKSSMTSAAGDTATENVHSMTTRSKGKKPKKVD